MNDVTRILNAIDQGDPQATEKLLPLVYDELRRLAAHKMSQELPGQTLQATALVHEAYIRLIGNDPQYWHSRGHFFAAAAEAMRRILVENARKKRRLKRGGGLEKMTLDESLLAADAQDVDLLALDEALDKLAHEDKIGFDIIKLRYFTGLTLQQAADCLGISHRSADRHWAYARAWLFQAMNEDNDP